MSTENELVVIERSNALDLFTTPKGLDPILAGIRKEIEAFVPDTSTRKGREAIASFVAKVARSKTYLDGMGKELVDRLKEQPKLVDAERKRIRDTLDAWRDEVRKPLTEYEESEKARVNKIQSKIHFLRLAASKEYEGSRTVEIAINEINGFQVDSSFAEFEQEALAARDLAYDALLKSLDMHKRVEEQQAELQKLRVEKEEREQKERLERQAQEAKEREERLIREAEERTRKEAEAKAAKEREDSIRRELELKLAHEASERKAKEEAERTERAHKAELARIEQEARQERERLEREEQNRQAEQAKREADEKHRLSIMSQSLKDLIDSGIEQQTALKVLSLIEKGFISNIKIVF
jgi:hypothetical protein